MLCSDCSSLISNSQLSDDSFSVIGTEIFVRNSSTDWGHAFCVFLIDSIGLTIRSRSIMA